MIISQSHGDASSQNIEILDVKYQRLGPRLVSRWLRSCYDTEEVGRIHAIILKCFRDSATYVDNNLICSYLRLGNLTWAPRVFDKMSRRDTITWTAIIDGYLNYNLVLGRHGANRQGETLWRNQVREHKMRRHHIQLNCSFLCKMWGTVECISNIGSEALQFLQEMMEEGVVPNAYTYSSLLKACANLEAPMEGRLIHSYASKTPALSNVFVNSALIYMYAKCGYVADALQVLDNMPERNLVSWKAMILGYARNGHCQEALKLMCRMQAEGFEVDDYILATVYTACGGGCEDIDWDNIESSSRYLLSSESSAR
ncbi:hypothetical protein PIB30_023339 [Stylosanthes scabra]|uniref:Pentatricopeptide repeat-containing protein n=1 Tax=Stylosanthes scabra TaxID=79078 RepID=A0ABU6T954_9FABA|nr:hypothetical protein [Stylosanthes scabra]